MVACALGPATAPGSSGRPAGPSSPTAQTSAGPIATTPAPGTIVTIAGTGADGHAGLDGPALGAELSTPVDLAFDARGNLFIAERYEDRVVVLGPDGILRLAAGSVGQDGAPIGGFSGDGGPATEARLDGVGSVALDAEGRLYIAETSSHRIRRVDASGEIETIAGTGAQGFSGDGGPAVAAMLQFPSGLVIADDGSVVFSDSLGLRIRRIDPEGDIETVAGSGAKGVPVEGAPAVATAFGGTDEHLPNGLAFDSAGRLYVTDYGSFRIWRIDDDGRMRSVAGDGSMRASGDGGSAVEASIAGPTDIWIGPAGELYVVTHTHADAGNQVRRVDPDGTIDTVAGDGRLRYGGDGGLAIAASLALPSGVAIGPDGNLYVADAGNHRIRMVVLEAPAPASAP